MIDLIDQAALDLVAKERERQLDKWGDQTHTPEQWKAILDEEVAEAYCQIMCEGVNEKTVAELSQIAAVAVAWMRQYLKKSLSK